MHPEKKRTPGLTQHFEIIRNIKSDLDSVINQIDFLQSQKRAEITNERESPERRRLLTEKELINNELNELFALSNSIKNEKYTIINELNALRDDIKQTKGTSSFRSMADIDKQKAMIEKKMMDCHYTNQQEKEYQATLLNLHKMKQSYGDLSGKEKSIHNLETKLQTIKSEFQKVNEDIEIRKKEQQELKNVIDDMRGNKKSDKIIEIEKQIDALYDRKKALTESRKKEYDIIKQKEEEHAKYLEVMSKQIEIENNKKDQKTKIRKMTEELVRLEAERSSYDANKYEAIIKELKKKKLSVGLISLLTDEKLNLPRCDDDYEPLLKVCEIRKKDFENGVNEKVLELDGRIREIEASIAEEKKALDAMPATEIGIARRKINIE